MKWFYNLKISAKLLTGFILVAVLAGVVGIVGYVNIQSMKNSDLSLYNDNTVPISELSTVIQQYQRIRIYALCTILNTDKSANDDYAKKIETCKKDMLDNLETFNKTIDDDNVRKEYATSSSLINDKFLPYIDDVMSLALENKDDQAFQLVNTTGNDINQLLQNSIDNLFKYEVELAGKTSQQNVETAEFSTIMMLGFAIAAILLAVALGIFISRLISKPVKELVTVADKLSLGDIKVSVEATTKDELGSLMNSFSKMIDNIRSQALTVEKIASGDMTIAVTARSEHDVLGIKLSEMVKTNNEVLGNINSAAEQVASGARQVSQSSMMLSQGSTEQASSVEEITSSMTQVAAQTKQNAINANQANELAETAKGNAISGNRQMQDMVKAMAEINDSSANISKIIKVIDEIAFQTNILALNAAVEAARAGQHGKGFAVVAEEVRNLAARSANAAKETTEMIEGSIKKVEIGTKLVDETAAALNKIVENVTKAANLVSDIAQASDEQAAGISQVNTAIEQVAQVVQANSATSEECAAASEELSGQAQLLRESVSRFRLKRTDTISNNPDRISPEMLRAIEGMIEKRKNQVQQAYDEKRQTGNTNYTPSISLDDNNFGKY